ncbi:MAG: APC family permease [Firmicutes bacterium]|nr:APC family permease [Bacillota bacterium]
MKTKKQHGLFVSICLVASGIVGTGIYFNPGRVLTEIEGNVGYALLAWIIAGLLVFTCVAMFAVLATKYKKLHGTVDYAEELVGKRYGYLVGWFFCMMYQTAGFALIARITAGFIATLFGQVNHISNPFIPIVTISLMTGVFLMNFFIPKVPMKFNVVTTILRVIPIIAMAIVGVIVGLLVGNSVPPVPGTNPVLDTPALSNFMAALFACVFVFNGWQAATAFNHEIKDSKRKFPLAMIIGFLSIFVLSIAYFGGLIAVADPSNILVNNNNATYDAFAFLFGGEWAGKLFTIFIITSGVGILNLCGMGMSRGLLSVAKRGHGPFQKYFSQVHEKTGTARYSLAFCFLISLVWFVVLYLSQSGLLPTGFVFTLQDFYNLGFYALLVPIFILFIIKQKEMHWALRFVLPTVAICAVGILVVSLAIASWIHFLIYIGVFIIIGGIGMIFYRKDATSQL